MPEWVTVILIYAGLVIAALGGLACIFLTLLQMPGTWVMMGIALLAAGLTHLGFSAMEVIALVVMLALGLLGELVEFVAGAVGSRVTGGTKRGATLAIVGSIAGAIIGTFAIPVPIIGTLIGACVGAAVGSIAGDKWAGREWKPSLFSGTGAAVGKLGGTIAKVVIACVMWVASLFALFGG